VPLPDPEVEAEADAEVDEVDPDEDPDAGNMHPPAMMVALGGGDQVTYGDPAVYGAGHAVQLYPPAVGAVLIHVVRLSQGL